MLIFQNHIECSVAPELSPSLLLVCPKGPQVTEKYANTWKGVIEIIEIKHWNQFLLFHYKNRYLLFLILDPLLKKKSIPKIEFVSTIAADGVKDKINFQ